MGDAYVPPLPIIILMMWLFHLVPLLLIAVPLWFFGRKRVDWNAWDFAIVVIPFAVWCWITLITGNSEKQFLFIGLIAPLAPVLRLHFGKRFNEKCVAFELLVFQCILSVVLVFFLPWAIGF